MGRSSGLEFCCCAIPLVNFGAYFLVLEFFFVALVTAILSLGTPSIVAGQTVIPSFSKYLIFIIALISLFWQPLGLFSIAKQRTKLYRFYIRINFLLTIVEIVLAAVFFIVAAVQHNKAKENCNNLYGNTPSSTNSNSASLIDVSTALNGTGEQICNYFIWAQVGAMGLLLVLMGLTQLYMCFAQRSYGRMQREAERSYKNSSGPHDEIPLAARDSAVWEAPSDSRGAYGHAYSNSQQYANNPNSNSYPRGYEEEDLDADRRYGGGANDHYEDYNHNTNANRISTRAGGGAGGDSSYPSYAPEGARGTRESGGSEAFYAR